MDYQIVHAAPKRHAASAANRQAICLDQASFQAARTPLADGGNVVLNALVGSGAPETVTVGAEGSGEAWETLEDTVAPAARIVKREDVEYMMPCVELRNRRK
jgi:hypothetical protein